MKFLILIVVLVPTIVYAQEYNIQDANQYMIYNGEYTPYPIENRDSEAPSFWERINPVTHIKNMWNALPSFPFWKSSEESEHMGMEMLQESESNPQEITVPFPNFMHQQISSPQLSFGGSNLFSGIPSFPGMSPFMRSSSGHPNVPPPNPSAQQPQQQDYQPVATNPSVQKSQPQAYQPVAPNPSVQKSQPQAYQPVAPHHVHKRSPNMEHSEKKGPVKTFYKSVGQGAYIKAEVPVPGNDMTKAAHKKYPVGSMSTGQYPYQYQYRNPSPYYNSMPMPLNYNNNYKPPPMHYNPNSYYHHSYDDYSDYSSHCRSYQGPRPSYHKDEKEEEAKAPVSTEDDDNESSDSDNSTEMEDPFPCPKVGVWTYDGTWCTTLGVSPTWSCKPIDLVQSGRLVICRNKVFL